MKRSLSLIVVLAMLLAALTALSASADDSEEHIFIDETVDKSKSIVVGTVTATNADSGRSVTAEVCRYYVPVAYSSPRSEDVEALITQAAQECAEYAARCKYAVTEECEVTASVPSYDDGTLWDSRKYETVEESEVLPGGGGDIMPPITGKTIYKHIASGTYGKITTYTVALEAEAPDYVTLCIGSTAGGGAVINGTEYDDVSLNMMVEFGEECEFTAIPDEGYVFKGWYEGIMGQWYYVDDHTDVLICADSTYSFAAAEPLMIQAVFAEATALTGDVNCDGTVSNRDAMILDRFVAGWADYDRQIKSTEAADLNRDTKVNNRDAMILDRFVAGWEGYDKFIILV